MRVIYRYFTNTGTEVRRQCDTVEQALLALRRARRSDGGNFRTYSIDSGKTWVQF